MLRFDTFNPGRLQWRVLQDFRILQVNASRQPFISIKFSFVIFFPRMLSLSCCWYLLDRNNCLLSLFLSRGIILPLRKTETTKSDLESSSGIEKCKIRSKHETPVLFSSAHPAIVRFKDTVARLLGSNKLTRISAFSFTILSFGTIGKSPSERQAWIRSKLSNGQTHSLQSSVLDVLIV